MEHNYTKVCPKCNSTDIRTGKQQGYAVISNGGFKTSKVIYYLCGNCGYVVDQFIERPDKMKEIKKNVNI